jgi:hypothetical protein
MLQSTSSARSLKKKKLPSGISENATIKSPQGSFLFFFPFQCKCPTPSAASGNSFLDQDNFIKEDLLTKVLIYFTDSARHQQGVLATAQWVIGKAVRLGSQLCVAMIER